MQLSKELTKKDIDDILKSMDELKKLVAAVAHAEQQLPGFQEHKEMLDWLDKNSLQMAESAIKKIEVEVTFSQEEKEDFKYELSKILSLSRMSLILNSFELLDNPELGEMQSPCELYAKALMKMRGCINLLEFQSPNSARLFRDIMKQLAEKISK